MDSSSSSFCSSQNWLAFSLSNYTPTQLNDSSHLSLFEAFNTNTGVAERKREEKGTCRKLEDFLGGCGGQFSSEETPSTILEAELYDSELKSIAASFLRGFSSEQADPQNPVVVAKQAEQPPKKAVDTFGQRTSIYRGVTRHRWTGRYEAHLWDNSCRREGQSRRGRQVYLGGYDKEEKAARAYDLAALKYWGPTTTTNFPVSNYKKELEDMKNMTRQEFVASLRRKSSGFSRGASIYRGVTRHHQHGRWQARIGRVAGNKDLYLGTFSTQEEAAEAYDIAAIKFRGLNAVTNFDMSRYDVKSIANSNLPVGCMTTKSKTSSESISDNKSTDAIQSDDRDHLSSASSSTFISQSHPHSHSQPTTNPSNLTFALPIKPDPTECWSLLSFQNPSNVPNVGKSPIGVQLPFNMDLSLNEVINNNNNASVFNGGGLFHQQNTATTSVVPIVGLSGSEGTSSWIAPSLHSFQTAKPNLSVFQTPIFGME